MAQKAADDCHAQSVVESENGKCVARGVKGEGEGYLQFLTDYVQGLVDALGGGVAGLVEGFGIVEAEVIFHKVEHIFLSPAHRLPFVKDAESRVCQRNFMTMVGLDEDFAQLAFLEVDVAPLKRHDIYNSQTAGMESE